MGNKEKAVMYVLNFLRRLSDCGADSRHMLVSIYAFNNALSEVR